MPSIFQKKSFSVLVVDDNQSVQDSLKELVSVYNLHVSLAYDGQHALNYLTHYSFDLVLLDIEMPNINGFQVMSEIQNQHPETDIIIISGKSSFNNAQQTLRTGVKDFINKPFDPAELINSIQRIVEQRLKNKTTSVHSSVENTLIELDDIIHNEDLAMTNEIINSSPAVAFVWKNSLGWPVHFVSSNVVNLLGYSDSDFISRKIIFSDLVHPNDKERVKNEVATNNETIKFNHKPYRLRSKSGTYIWVDDSTSVVRDEQGNISYYQGILIDITEREIAHQNMIKAQMVLEHAAQHDPLTGLPNRILLMDRLHQSIKSSLREKKLLAVFFIDLDKFKEINDSLGHDAGDEVLIIVARRLTGKIRAIDTIARIGGDEFIFLMQSVSNISDIKVMAKKIIKALKQPVHWKNNIIVIASSIGISLSPDDATDAQELMKKADNAMYQAKNKAPDNFVFYGSSN